MATSLEEASTFQNYNMYNKGELSYEKDSIK